MKVPISQLQIFNTNSVRLAVLARMVVDVSAKGIKFPVQVVESDDGYIILDGTYRVLAAKCLGHTEIEVEVVQAQACLLPRYHVSALIGALEQQLVRYNELVRAISS